MQSSCHRSPIGNNPAFNEIPMSNESAACQWFISCQRIGSRRSLPMQCIVWSHGIHPRENSQQQEAACPKGCEGPVTQEHCSCCSSGKHGYDCCNSAPPPRVGAARKRGIRSNPGYGQCENCRGEVRGGRLRAPQVSGQRTLRTGRTSLGPKLRSLVATPSNRIAHAEVS